MEISARCAWGRRRASSFAASLLPGRSYSPLISRTGTDSDSSPGGGGNADGCRSSVRSLPGRFCVPPAESRQASALSDKPGTPARSADISRLTCCSMVKRSRISLALVTRRECPELLSAATTRRCWSKTGTARRRRRRQVRPRPRNITLKALGSRILDNRGTS
jgi:hypothetical protein